MNRDHEKNWSCGRDVKLPEIKVPEYFRTEKTGPTRFDVEDAVGKETVYRACRRLHVQMVDTWDEMIIQAIKNACAAEGITDVTLLNKHAILEAIVKQIPKATHYQESTGTYFCPSCLAAYSKGILEFKPPYCALCGQRLEWEE